MGCTSATTQTAGCACEGGDPSCMSRARRAGVLVPCRVYSIRGTLLISGGTTVAVRLSKSSQGTWRVPATHPAQPGAPVASLSTAARQVLASEQITLPPASAADIHSGQVHDSA